MKNIKLDLLYNIAKYAHISTFYMSMTTLLFDSVYYKVIVEKPIPLVMQYLFWFLFGIFIGFTMAYYSFKIIYKYENDRKLKNMLN